MAASYYEIARSTRIFGNFAGGKKHPTERKSIDEGKSERSTRFRIWKLQESIVSSSAGLKCENGKINICFDDHHPTLQSF